MPINIHLRPDQIPEADMIQVYEIYAQAFKVQLYQGTDVFPSDIEVFRYSSLRNWVKNGRDIQHGQPGIKFYAYQRRGGVSFQGYRDGLMMDSPQGPVHEPDNVAMEEEFERIVIQYFSDLPRK